MFGFIILAVVLLAGGIGVITFRQPVHAALSLVATLLTLAVTYITLEAHFLAAIQTIVYAGAIMVLFLFVIMLLNVGGESSAERLPGLRPAAYLAGLLAAAGIAVTAFLDPRQLPSAEMIQAALGGGGAERVGESLFGDFLLAFHLVGVLLLVGIVGAVSLVQRKSHELAGDAGAALDEPERELTRA
ncbi:MAG TPA: NADH-quinone oxidoreductase subunit J [Trueperaceae bacterium]